MILIELFHYIRFIIFQYPVRPCSMSYDSVEVLDSKVKSKQQQVEITLSLNTNSSNYDESKGKIDRLFYT